MLIITNLRLCVLPFCRWRKIVGFRCIFVYVSACRGCNRRCGHRRGRRHSRRRWDRRIQSRQQSSAMGRSQGKGRLSGGDSHRLSIAAWGVCHENHVCRIRSAGAKVGWLLIALSLWIEVPLHTFNQLIFVAVSHPMILIIIAQTYTHLLSSL